MQKRIKIGVLGCAAIAERSVIPAILELPEYFELVAIASRDQQKAESLAARFNCQAVHGYEELIDNSAVEAIYVPLPTGLHDEWVNKALNKGLHVYAEKSIGLNLPECQNMVENAKRNHAALMEGFMFQYHGQHAMVKELIEQGRIGEIRYFTSSFGFPPLAPSNFRYDPNVGGGALYDAGAYPVRASFFLLGDDLKVAGASIKRDPETGASLFGSAYLMGANGVGASISFGFDNFYQCSYTFWGSKGKLTAERAFTPRPEMAPSITLETDGNKEILQTVAEDHFVKALEEFHSIIVQPDKRKKHFKEIIQQSNALEVINSY